MERITKVGFIYETQIFFIITYLTELCCLAYQAWKKRLACKQPMSHVSRPPYNLGPSFSQGSPIFLCSLHCNGSYSASSKKSLLLVLYHWPSLTANKNRLITSRNTRNSNLRASSSAGVRQGILIGVCLSYLDNISLCQNLWQWHEFSKSLLFRQI